jgi:hypothetical protein
MIYEEDPVEAYKREFKRKRWESEQAAKAIMIEWQRQVHRFSRYCAFPIVAFACILLLDKYLPAITYNEVAELGWQERGAGRRNPRLYSYMQTESFVFGVPYEAHLNYPYYEEEKPVMKIEATRIFNIPVHASFTFGDDSYSFILPDNIHMYFIPLSWMLLASALFTILVRKYSKLTYSISFLPLLLLAWVILKML